MVEKIVEMFNKSFRHFDIKLPEDIIESRGGGCICNRGMMVKFLFGSDKKGEYLDYYSAHRMTNDSHIRIYADGTTKNLPALIEMRLGSDDPAEDARLEEEFLEKNRRINDMLAEKGFGMQGYEPGGVLMNWALKTGKADKD